MLLRFFPEGKREMLPSCEVSSKTFTYLNKWPVDIFMARIVSVYLIVGNNFEDTVSLKPPGCDRIGKTELRDLDGPTVMQLCLRLSRVLFHARLSYCTEKTVTSASCVKLFSSFCSEHGYSWNALCLSENLKKEMASRVWADILNQVCVFLQL